MTSKYVAAAKTALGFVIAGVSIVEGVATANGYMGVAGVMAGVTFAADGVNDLMDGNLAQAISDLSSAFKTTKASVPVAETEVKTGQPTS